jgi:tetratricopeptide (TPR) repeat protein
LANELDHLRAIPSRDATLIADAVERLLRARKAAFEVSYPDAILYASAAYDMVDGHLMVLPSAAWAPLLRDLIDVENALFDPRRKAKSSRLWWYAVSLVEGGAFDQAEAAARESCEITRYFDAVGARSHAGRDVVLARALAGQGRVHEALPLLESSIDALSNRMDNRNGVQFVAAVLDVYSAIGRPAAVTETLVPYLERVLAQSNDATFLNHVVSRLSAREQLDPAVRRLAIQLARRATEIRPNDPLNWRLLALAAEAAGDAQTAGEAREKLSAAANPDESR